MSELRHMLEQMIGLSWDEIPANKRVAMIRHALVRHIVDKPTTGADGRVRTLRHDPVRDAFFIERR